jgi:hypothetical protein
MFSGRKYEYFPHLSDRKKVGKKGKCFMMRFLYKPELIMKTAAEESFRRNMIFTTLDFVINNLANRLEEKYLWLVLSSLILSFVILQ